MTRETGETKVVNRGATILRYLRPAIEWINEADPVADSCEVTSDMLKQDLTVYLISEGDAGGDLEVSRWVESNFAVLFEAELEGWYTDTALWPQDRTLELFRHWFDVEFHSTIVDTVDDVFIDEDE